ncbi:MAG: hypothetical protein RIC24_01385 [Hyphomicrobiales bacterium]|jgi:hypothetical protein
MTRHYARPSLAFACFALFSPISSLNAQTIDVAQLPGGIDLTITILTDENVQVLSANGNEILRAPAITIDLDMFDINGEPAGLIVQAAAEDPACPASPYGVTVQFGQPWLQGPIGQLCVPYASAGYPGGAILFSPPELYRDGDAVMFDLEQGAYRLGPISYAPQEGRGWDALDGEVGGYNDLSALDLYAAQPVYDALWDKWQDELSIFARHLGTRTIPVIEGNFLLQTGCLPGQCAFAIGMLAVNPASEEVYSAFLNEGAPDIRPPLEEWSADAQNLYERWSAGEFR